MFVFANRKVIKLTTTVRPHFLELHSINNVLCCFRSQSTITHLVDAESSSSSTLSESTSLHSLSHNELETKCNNASKAVNSPLHLVFGSTFGNRIGTHGNFIKESKSNNNAYKVFNHEGLKNKEGKIRELKNNCEQDITCKKHETQSSSTLKSEEHQARPENEEINKLSETSTLLSFSSEFSYRYLLDRGAFVSVMQLVNSPFAPSPLRVFRDLLHILEYQEEYEEKEEEQTSKQEQMLLEAQERKEQEEEQINESKLCTSQNKPEMKEEEEEEQQQQHEVGKRNAADSVAIVEANELEVIININNSNNMKGVTRAHVIEALTAPGEVRQLMRKAYTEIRNVMDEFNEMNDLQSIEAARAKVEEVSGFIEYLHTFMSHQTLFEPSHAVLPSLCDPETNRNNARSVSSMNFTKNRSLVYKLPDAVYAEVLHYLLQMCCVTGLHLSAVSVLDEIIMLSERVQMERKASTLNKNNNNNNNNIINYTTTDKSRNDNIQSNDMPHVFSIDQIVHRVQRFIANKVHIVNAQDHIAAMQSCALHKMFNVALSLYRRFIIHATEGRFALTSFNLQTAIIALSSCVNSCTEFDTLRHILLEQEAAATLPVSVSLYTALLEALSRLPNHPNQLSMALALYRRLRDGALQLSVNSYAALMACSVGAFEAANPHCLTRAKELTISPFSAFNNNNSIIDSNYRNNAATVVSNTYNNDYKGNEMSVEYRDPLQSFAFYHEARANCNIAHFTSSLYTSLVKSYVHGGYGIDAKNTLDVLMESGAPLSLASFHALLSSSSITLRDGQEIVEKMIQQYKISPTPITYGWLIAATVRQRMRVEATPKLNNVNYILQLFDFHELAVQSFTTLHCTASNKQEEQYVITNNIEKVCNSSEEPLQLQESSIASTIQSKSSHNSNTNLTRTTTTYSCMSAPASQDAALITTYPFYVLSLQNALMHVKAAIYSSHLKQRIAPYLLPLIRLAQLQMNVFTGMPPQVPTQLSQRGVLRNVNLYNNSNNDNVNNNNNNDNSDNNVNTNKRCKAEKPTELCVAVLAADVLLSLEESVLPFIHFYSAIVIPFSALLTFQCAITVKDLLMDSNDTNYYMTRLLNVETNTSSSSSMTMTATTSNLDETLYDQVKLQKLRRFLQEYKDVIHLGSIDEELELNGVADRYGVYLRDEVESSFGKVAVTAIHLARKDVIQETQEEFRESEHYNNIHSSSLCTLYAQHNVHMIAVSNRFQECGKFIVRLKREYLSGKYRMHKKRVEYNNLNNNNSNNDFSGLCDALSRVFYHNPSVYPNWTPPSLNVRNITPKHNAKPKKEQQEHHHHHHQQQRESKKEEEEYEEMKSSNQEEEDDIKNVTGNVRNTSYNNINDIDAVNSKDAQELYTAFINICDYEANSDGSNNNNNNSTEKE